MALTTATQTSSRRIIRECNLAGKISACQVEFTGSRPVIRSSYNNSNWSHRIVVSICLLDTQKIKVQFLV
jgi:hypothetical protein